MSLYQQTEDLERLVMSPVKAMALGKEAEPSSAGLTLLMEPGGHLKLSSGHPAST